REWWWERAVTSTASPRSSSRRSPSTGTGAGSAGSSLAERSCPRHRPCPVTNRVPGTGPPVPATARPAPKGGARWKRKTRPGGGLTTAEGKLDRLAIARCLREMARLLDLAAHPRFKVRAYERAAQALERLSSDLGRLVVEERLTELHGIGPRLAAVISELYRTGGASGLEEG